MDGMGPCLGEAIKRVGRSKDEDDKEEEDKEDGMNQEKEAEHMERPRSQRGKGSREGESNVQEPPFPISYITLTLSFPSLKNTPE